LWFVVILFTNECAAKQLKNFLHYSIASLHENVPDFKSNIIIWNCSGLLALCAAYVHLWVSLPDRLGLFCSGRFTRWHHLLNAG